MVRRVERLESREYRFPTFGLTYYVHKGTLVKERSINNDGNNKT